MANKLKYAIIVFFVLILMGAQPCLYWYILKGKQSKVHKQAQSLIALKKIKKTYTLRINRDKIFTSLKWKNNHEFYKDGFICDVVALNYNGLDIVIDYIHDKKETEIESSIKKLFNKNTEQNKKKFKTKTFHFTYLQNEDLKQKPLSYHLIKKILCCVSFYQSLNLSPPNPPPWS